MADYSSKLELCVTPCSSHCSEGIKIFLDTVGQMEFSVILYLYQMIADVCIGHSKQLSHTLLRQPECLLIEQHGDVHF